MKCAVFGCTNGYKKSAVECSLFTFPTNPSLARKWMKFCRQGKGFNFKNCVICMDHFEREDVVNNLQYELGFANKRILKRDVVPTIYKVQVEKQKITEEQPSDRVRRRENRNILSEAPTSHEGIVCNFLWNIYKFQYNFFMVRGRVFSWLLISEI
uniref:THAP-type domain-containing protein n=1 Tax=Ceratitis capitata TaxID=7213 RepID=W8BEW0_CERCA